MREELVRTEEENERYKQLVDINRERRELLRQQLLEIKKIAIPQVQTYAHRLIIIGCRRQFLRWKCTPRESLYLRLNELPKCS